VSECELVSYSFTQLLYHSVTVTPLRRLLRHSLPLSLSRLYPLPLAPGVRVLLPALSLICTRPLLSRSPSHPLSRSAAFSAWKSWAPVTRFGQTAVRLYASGFLFLFRTRVKSRWRFQKFPDFRPKLRTENWALTTDSPKTSFQCSQGAWALGSWLSLSSRLLFTA